MIQNVPINTVKANPNNPRIIKDDKFAKLVKSINEFPQMLNLRPIVVNDDMVVLGGNMRLKALKSSGVFDVPIHQVFGWTNKQKREFIIKDNVGFGEWDWDILANEWDAELLDYWGLNIPVVEAEFDDEQFIDDDANDQDSETITIKIVLSNKKSMQLLEKLESMKGDKSISDYLFDHFCN